MESYLQGRLRNTPLPLGHGLLPLFEAVVNSIHSIEERGNSGSAGSIEIEVLRSPQTSLAPPLEHIVGQEAGFSVQNTGVVEVEPPVDGGSAICSYPVAPSQRFAEHIALLATYDAAADGAKLVA